MNSQDTPRLRKALERAAVTFKQPVSEELLGVYFDALRDLFISQVEDAIAQHVSRGRWFPRPADIRRRCGDESETARPAERSKRCRAPSCPNPISSFDHGCCRFHARQPTERWQEITDAILRGDPAFEYPPDFKQRADLSYLCASGQYAAMEAVCGERGLRWARAEVKAGRLKPGSWVPDPKAVAQTRAWLDQLRSTGAIPADPIPAAPTTAAAPEIAP